MHQDGTGAYLIQVTWLPGDEFDIDVGGGYHMFRHNRDGGEGSIHGVAIILPPTF